MEEKKKICPCCNRELKEPETLENIRAVLASSLYYMTMDAIAGKNADLTTLEQIRRNCETVVKMIYEFRI